MDNLRHQFENRGNERLVLACVLQRPASLVEIATRISEADFLSEHHRALYSVLVSLASQGAESFDLMAVVNEAADKGVLELVGGADYVSALMYTDVSAENADVYVSKVLDSSIKYRLYKELEATQERVLANLSTTDSAMPAAELLTRAESGLLELVATTKQVGEGVNICAGAPDFVAELGRNPVEIRGLGTGVPLLDYHINGLTPGSLTVVSGRQKGGKSTLLTNIAANIAIDQGLPVLYIDTEMTTREVMTRLVAHRSGVPERDVGNGTFIRSPNFCTRIEKACASMRDAVFIHEYMPGYTIDSLRSVIRKYHAKYGIAVFFFDYIKLPESGLGAFNESQMLGIVTTALKDMAGRLDIPGVAGAQIKRGDTASPKSRFNENDVGDSDKIGRFCTHLLAIAPKSRKEQEEDGMSCGTHRLQVLLTRSGKPSYHGIDLQCTFPTSTIKQAEHQSGGSAAEAATLTGNW